MNVLCLCTISYIGLYLDCFSCVLIYLPMITIICSCILCGLGAMILVQHYANEYSDALLKQTERERERERVGGGGIEKYIYR